MPSMHDYEWYMYHGDKKEEEIKMSVDELLTGEVFDKAFAEYKDECIGISMSVCDSYYRPGELEEKYKNSARWLVKKILDEFLKVKPEQR